MTTPASTLAPFPAPDVDAAVRRALTNAGSWHLPALDATSSPQMYSAMAQDLRSSAWRHLEEGDLAQASNDAWCLMAETIKTITVQHGGVIRSYVGMGEVISELARLVGNAGDAATATWIHRGFLVAGSLLNFNFYEPGLPETMVRYGLMDCEEVSERLYYLFGVPAPAV